MEWRYKYINRKLGDLVHMEWWGIIEGAFGAPKTTPPLPSLSVYNVGGPILCTSVPCRPRLLSNFLGAPTHTLNWISLAGRHGSNTNNYIAFFLDPARPRFDTPTVHKCLRHTRMHTSCFGCQSRHLFDARIQPCATRTTLHSVRCHHHSRLPLFWATTTQRHWASPG
jgi:hypothetical protein